MIKVAKRFTESRNMHGQKSEAKFDPRRMEARRIELGLSQAQAAEKSGMKQSQWSQYEARGSVPGADVLVRIAQALDCPTDYLVGLARYPDSSYTEDTIERRLLYDFRTHRNEAFAAALNKQVHGLPKLLRSQIIRAIKFLEEHPGVGNEDVDDL